VQRRLSALAALAVLALAVAFAVDATALAAGPSYVSAGGLGVRSADGKARYVALPMRDQTAIARVRASDGSVETWAELDGAWGIPQPTPTAAAEGLFRNGTRLVVGTFGIGSPSRFAIVDTRRMRVDKTFSLDGSFAYDALSPDGSTLYLIQHVNLDNLDRYVVRAYDLDEERLLPGRIADKTQPGWVMQGTALARGTSADGRWVYTLYSRPGGYPFIHALDAVEGVAHCTGLPWRGDQAALVNLRLTPRGDGRSVAVHWKSGKPWLTLDATSWRLRHADSASTTWPWFAATAAAGALALALAALALRRRRAGHDRTEVLPQPL
jgi:hypothetical protein